MLNVKSIYHCEIKGEGQAYFGIIMPPLLAFMRLQSQKRSPGQPAANEQTNNHYRDGTHKQNRQKAEWTSISSPLSHENLSTACGLS